MMLAIVLMSLMTATVVLGTWSTLVLRSRFDSTIQSDVPRLQNLLHLDRDLFRGQRSLEISLLEPDHVQRVALIAEYDRQVNRTAGWWDKYLATSAGLDNEIAWQSEYTAARDSWITSSEALAVLAENDGSIQSAAVASQLTTTQEDFAAVRSIADKLEEQVAEPQIDSATSDLRGKSTSTVIEMLALLLFGLGAGGITSLTTYRAAKKQHLTNRKRDHERVDESDRAAFEAELNQALDMAQSEDAGFRTIAMVIDTENPGRPTELLLADSSQAHLKQVISTDKNGSGPGCPALAPSDCPAIRRGTTLTFRDGGAYSACPNLRDRGGDPCSAVCVPVSVAGRTVGALHTTGPNMEIADRKVVSRLEEIADRSGDRIGVLRAFAKSQTQAATDPLTGLANRRSFENEVSMMLKQGTDLAVAYGDLDHFKKLNDTYGHDAGDRALRLFSKVVRDSLRDMDMAARWGGEEFVLMFGNSDASTAAAALDRLRQNLAIAQAGGTTAPFTASFGVTDTMCSNDLEELVNMADEALLKAKTNGRDRVVVSGRSSSQSPGDESIPSDTAAQDEDQGLTTV